MRALPRARCPEAAQLLQFANGALGAGKHFDVVHHLEDCLHCRRVVAALSRRSSKEHPALPATGPRGLGRYQVKELISRSGSEILYLGHDPKSSRDVALRVLPATAQGDAADARVSLLTEAHALSRLRHPNLVSIYDVGVEGDRVFLVMDVVRGVNGLEWLHTHSPTPGEILEVFVHAARGLAGAHAGGVLHRAFRAESILIGDRERGHVWVTGFGLTNAFANAEREGTLETLAPEQLLGKRSSSRSDQFSFCSALYEAFYGMPPYAGLTREDLLLSMERGVHVPRKAGVSRQVRRTLEIGLSIDPEDRFPTMGALLESFEAEGAGWQTPVAGALAAMGLVAAGSYAWIEHQLERGAPVSDSYAQRLEISAPVSSPVGAPPPRAEDIFEELTQAPALPPPECVEASRQEIRTWDDVLTQPAQEEVEPDVQVGTLLTTGTEDSLAE
ncbi:MAG: serine/threonine protein kinase [Myxococcaceae bacterium]